MNIYLDTSALNRIFDDQSQPRIYLEASAMILVFAMLGNKVVKLVSSEALIYENGNYSKCLSRAKAQRAHPAAAANSALAEVARKATLLNPVIRLQYG